MPTVCELYTALHCTALHCTTLHCTALYFSTRVWRVAVLAADSDSVVTLRDKELPRSGGYRSVQCSVQCIAVQCSAVQCSAVQCSAVQCSAVQCSAQWKRAVLFWWKNHICTEKDHFGGCLGKIWCPHASVNAKYQFIVEKYQFPVQKYWFLAQNVAKLTYMLKASTLPLCSAVQCSAVLSQCQ
jgi:hypothetical protein